MRLTDLRTFQDDLNAALAAGIVLEINAADRSDSRTQKLTANKLNRLEALVRPHCRADDDSSDGRLASEDFWQQLSNDRSNGPGLPSRYVAALRVFSETRSMVPVLDGLSIRRRTEQQTVRALIWTFAHLLLLLTVTLAGMFLFLTYVIPLINEVRHDMTPMRTTDELAPGESVAWFSRVLGCFGAGLILVAMWSCLGGMKRIVGWLGGRSVVRSHSSKSALQTTDLLVRGGMPIQEAVELSCDLVGLDAAGRTEIQESVNESEDRDLLANLADFYYVASLRRLNRMKTVTSFGLLAIFGGLVGLSYCLAIFWPIISLLNDMGKVVS